MSKNTLLTITVCSDTNKIGSEKNIQKEDQMQALEPGTKRKALKEEYDNSPEGFMRYYSSREEIDVNSLLIIILCLDSKIEERAMEEKEVEEFLKKSMDNSVVKFGELLFTISCHFDETRKFLQNDASPEREARILNRIVKALFAP